MVVSISGSTSNLMRALQQQIAQQEAERNRKVANIYGGVQGFTGAQAVKQMQDNIARLAAMSPLPAEAQAPYSGTVYDQERDPITGEQRMSLDKPAPTPSALANLDTGGWFARFAGGMNGPEDYQRRMQQPLELAMLQDRRMREDAIRQQGWNREDQIRQAGWSREDQIRMAKLAQQAAEREAVARGYGLDGVDPNVPVDALDNLQRLKAKRDAEKRQREADEKIRSIVFSDAMRDPITGEQTQSAPDPFRLSTPEEFTGGLARSGLGSEGIEKATDIYGGLQPKPEPLSPYDRSYQSTKGRLAATPPKQVETQEQRIARIEAESAARERGAAAGSAPKAASPPADALRWLTPEERSEYKAAEAALVQTAPLETLGAQVDTQTARSTIKRLSGLAAQRRDAGQAPTNAPTDGETRTAPDGSTFRRVGGRWVKQP